MHPRTILITGASVGVGFSLVEHLKVRFSVVAVARRIERMRTTFADDASVFPIGADLSDPEETERLMEGIFERFGPIFYAINNAGVMSKAETTKLDAGDLLRSFRLNTLAPQIVLRRLLPGMRERGFGRVVNVTSGAPFNCFPGFGAYSASKAALNALTMTAARENADRDIKINLMSPGPVRTEMAPTAEYDPAICHPTLDHLLALGPDGPTGRFFWLGYEIPTVPDLEGIDWLGGTASDRFRKIL
jgi:NAD(P)-dependent dehydrogenase (short-subunit alcohol dehydrogenase family)